MHVAGPTTFGISQPTRARVIDMQTDFLHREGRLGRHYDAARHEVLAKTIKQVERLLLAARSAGLTVAHSRCIDTRVVRRDLLEGPQPEAPTGIDESRQHFGKVDLGYELLPALRGACVAYPLLSFLFMPTSLVSWLLEQPSLARLSSTSGPLARSRRPTSRSAFVSAVSVRYSSAAYSQMCVFATAVQACDRLFPCLIEDATGAFKSEWCEKAATSSGPQTSQPCAAVGLYWRGLDGRCGRGGLCQIKRRSRWRLGDHVSQTPVSFSYHKGR